jgi:hypothetical protein
MSDESQKPKDWMDIALDLALNGDKFALDRKAMLDKQTRASMDGMSRNSVLAAEEDRRRGISRGR